MNGNYLHKYSRLIRTPPHKIARKIKNRSFEKIQEIRQRREASLDNTHLSRDAFLESWDLPVLNQKDFSRQLRQGLPSLFLNVERCKDDPGFLSSFCPGVKYRIISAAKKILMHEFDLLGSGPEKLGKEIDWHMDFKSGHQFDPDLFFGDISPAPYPGGHDIKVPWELSRFHYLVWLGQAYWITKDEKYAVKIVSLVSDWIEKNPPLKGVNWVCSMEVAIRSVNWLWAFEYVRHSPSVSDEFILAFYKSLLTHGRHIRRNLEWLDGDTHNHYLSNIVGLVYLGVMLFGFRDAEKWTEFGLRELESEMRKIVYEDGVSYESSTSYHRLVTELFLSATIFSTSHGYQFSDVYMRKLEKMLEYVMCLTRPDGTVPLIGDNDNGRLHRLSIWPDPLSEWQDYRYLLNIGAVLFQRRDFAIMAGDKWEDAIWFFGEKVLEFKKASRKTESSFPDSCLFENSGICVMRADSIHVVIDAGPNGKKNMIGHGHCDTLSFEFFEGGSSWIIDPGCFVYTADYEQRHMFRTTPFHNTVMIDGIEQNLMDSRIPFKMNHDARTKILAWETDRQYDRLLAEHYGYKRLKDPAIHQREFILQKNERVLSIKDRIASRKDHQIKLFFNLNTCIRVQEQTSDRVVLWDEEKRRKLVMDFMGRDLRIILKKGYAAKSYGIKEKTSVIEIESRADFLETRISCRKY